MNKFFKTILLASVIFGGLWILLNLDQIRQEGGLGTFAQNRLSQLGNSQDPYHWSQQSNSNFQQQSNSVRRPPFIQTSSRVDNRGFANNSQPSSIPLASRIRIASFKLNLAATNPNNRQALAILADVCLKYDLVAFQEIDGQSRGWLNDLTDEIGRQSYGRAVYQSVSDHARVARGQAQYAFVFNAQSLDLDFNQAYTVADPDGLLQRAPMVGWFRTKAAHPSEAFTFTVANLQLNHQRPGDELVHLGDLFRAIRNDGRGEDDIIMVGDFGSGDRALETIQKRNGLTWVVTNSPTNTLKSAQYDNIVFNQTATVEFMGQGGVFDFLTIYNLSMQDALSISDHMPVWAEFSIFEDQYRGQR